MANRPVYPPGQPVNRAATVRAPRANRPPAQMPPRQPMPPHAANQPRSTQKKRRSISKWLIAGILGAVMLIASTCMALTVGGLILFNSGVLPGVQVAGIALGGLSEQEAAARLESEWMQIILRDGDRTWTVNPREFGIQLDAAATAAQAYQQGRGEGDLINAVLGGAEVPPVVVASEAIIMANLETLAPRVDIAPTDAGVAFVNGEVSATAPQDGRRLDVETTLSWIMQDAAALLADGTVDLAMQPVAPAVRDASALVDAASRLLQSALMIRVYDPVTGDSIYWEQPPGQWAAWITSADGGASGVSLSLNDVLLREFLVGQSNVFDETRYIDLDAAVAEVQNAVARGETAATLRVYHTDRLHTVQPGETITSIAWDYGVPYPWVQQANPGLDALTVGQQITIPSPDNFLPYAVVPDKRIIVDISEQRTYVYENGQTIQDWAASTGINSSPTWTGIYQILSHEINAYAGNWDLWMPNFMGVYQPVPGTNFTNGFHGFPTRGGGQLLWENSLGRRVTYGCILLSNTNVQWLYEWAETGVIVEIRA